jgi:pimeloyl-ACP methyl ester carboxylesterase
MKSPLSLVMYPGATRSVDPDQVRQSLHPGEELVWQDTSRGESVGLVIRPPSTGCGWIVFFYGNGMTVFGTARVRRRLGAAGSGVVCVEYPGYGVSSGSPTEGGCYRAADAALDYLRQRASVTAEQVALVGWSLGSAVAVDLASRAPVRALVLLSPLTSMLGAALDLARVGRTAFPVGPFDALSRAARVQCPTLIVSGTRDRLTRPWMADELTSAIGGPARRVDLPGVGHNNLLNSGDRLWAAVTSFLDAPAER